MKRLRIGRRRSQTPESSPLELALAPAVRDGRWRVPDRFNFTRDVVEVLARDVKRRALTFVGTDGIIEPRTFRELTEGAGRWAAILRGEDVGPGDRVLVLSGATVDWVELVLGCVKVGAIVVPSPPDLTASVLEARLVATGASLLVAGDESKAEIARMSFAPDVHHLFEGHRRRASDLVDEQPTEDTFARDIAFLVWTAGTSGLPKAAAHTHGATFAARCPAEHWLGAGPGDVIWCTAAPESLQALSTSLFGAWARGAEVAIHDGRFDPVERLELLHRFDVTIVCQTPAEYRALAGRRELARYRSRRLRRLVSTGDYLDPEVIATFEGAWGTTIRNGYGQAETNVVVAHGPENDAPADSLGRALPGHHVAIVDDQGNELPQGIEGSLAVRDRPPTLFAGYWDAPDETRDAFRGDWYLTGDVAVADEYGNFWFVSRAEDTITSRGRTFGPHEVERVLLAHDIVRDSAVVGIRDLERGGHFLRAFVILQAGVEGSEQLEAELRHSLGQSLVEQQVPREIEFIDALPTAPSGAVKRGELRERPAAGRPLWDVPPGQEPEVAAVVAPDPTAFEPFLVEHFQAPSEPSLAAEAAVVEPPTEAPPATPLPVDAPAPESHPATEVAEAMPAPELPAEPPAPAAVEPVAPEPPEPVTESAAELFVEPAAEQAKPLTPESPPSTPTTEAAVEVEPEKAPEPVAEAAPPPEPMAEPEPVSPAEAPEPPVTEPVPEPAPLEVAAETEQDTEAEPQPGSVIELVPPPEPPVDPTTEPLPDFVVPPGGVEERAPSPLPPPAPSPLEEDEEDLGPLPEYIVDPNRRLEPVATVQPEPSPAAPDPEAPPAPSFPSVPVLDLGATLGARRDADDTPSSPASSRQRPASPPTPPGRRGSAAEPGDEAEETTWMKGLSSRLSAYSLEDEGQERHEPEEDVDDEPREKEGD